MKLVAWGSTDVGRKRDHNEDALVIDPQQGLFAVADGMGGHFGGARASELAIEVLARELARTDISRTTPGGPSAGDPACQALETAARAAGVAIYETAQSEPTLAGMGTTLTALLVRDSRAYLAHVGDSRAYLYRDHQLTQLTTDHTWIGEQVRAGFMTPLEAQSSDLRHIVTRSVGYERDVQPELLAMPTLMGDCFLLCSDGLANYVDPRELRAHLEQGYYREVPGRLIEVANDLGGEDNITVLVLYIANDAG